MAKSSFLSGFQKELEKMEGVSTSSKPPRYWYSTGNHVMNKIISGSVYKGIPQGRITDLAGPSGSGKSFVAANLVKHAQDDGAMVLVVDSENALDDDFMGKIGCRTGIENDYYYAGVVTINDVTRVVSKFIRGYKDEYDNDPTAPQAFILIDSLDMLLTETEQDHYSKGNQKGDQGQRNKQLKQMLRTFVQDIKELNIVIVCTSQVYKNQDVTNGEGLWIVSDAVKYSASQIILLTKLKLKEKDGAVQAVTGIRMKAEGYKTRFTKPFQTVTVEVPYDTGMDPYSGLEETAVSMGVLEKRGNRLAFKGDDKTFFGKDIAEHAERILEAIESETNAYLIARLGESVVEDDDTESADDTAKRRAKRVSTPAE